MESNEPPSGTPVSRQRLRDLIGFEHRATVLRRLGVTAEWRVLDWTDSASCTDRREATQATCRHCPVVAECLAAAVATNDTGDWRGGLNRTDRDRLWAGLDRTYREVRDLESMRLDVTTADRAGRIAHLRGHQPGGTANGARS